MHVQAYRRMAWRPRQSSSSIGTDLWPADRTAMPLSPQGGAVPQETAGHRRYSRHARPFPREG